MASKKTKDCIYFVDNQDLTYDEFTDLIDELQSLQVIAKD